MKVDPSLRAARLLWPEDDTTNFVLFDHLHARGSPLEALFYAGLFWPAFVELEGMVFLARSIEDESDRERIRSMGMSKAPKEIEQAFNFVEIPSLFGRRKDETEDADDELLATMLARMWAAALQSQFPSRRFQVRVLPANEDTEVAIVFHQT